jgi:hypothetical protein
MINGERKIELRTPLMEPSDILKLNQLEIRPCFCPYCDDREIYESDEADFQISSLSCWGVAVLRTHQYDDQSDLCSYSMYTYGRKKTDSLFACKMKKGRPGVIVYLGSSSSNTKYFFSI